MKTDPAPRATFSGHADERDRQNKPKPDYKKLLIDPLAGLMLTLAISAAAIRLSNVEYVQKHLHFGALLLVILLGILWRNILPPPQWAMPGIVIAQKPVLRLGVALLGFKLSIDSLISVGGPSLVIVVVGVMAALAFGWWFGKAMGLHEKLTILMAVGGAICGASAIVAAESVVKAEKEDVVAPIGVITLFGTLGILIYPILGRALGMKEFLYGVWTGSSLHETAQVVAAAGAMGKDAVAYATIVKLARIAMLAPVVFIIAAWMRKKGEDAQAKIAIVPWFLVFFVLFALVNSWKTFHLSQPLLPDHVVSWINDTNMWVLCIGMAGVGLQTGFRDLKNAGFMPLLVGFAQWILLALITFAMASVLCKTPPVDKTQVTPNGNQKIQRPLT